MPTVRYSTINGEIIAERRDGMRRTYVPDPLGSTRALLDNQQKITDTFGYWPYGETMHRTGATPTPFKYTGTLGAAMSGDLLYVRARSMAPRRGQWMTMDPSRGTEGRITRYAYCALNPVTMRDPTGLREMKPNDPRWPRLPSRGPPGGIFTNPNCVHDQARRVYELINDKYSKLPEDQGGYKDAFRHCLWACFVLDKCGGATAYNCGVIDHERPGALWAKGKWDGVNSPMDLANDERGRKCHAKKMDCESCCHADLKAGNLYILPKKWWGKSDPTRDEVIFGDPPPMFPFPM